MATIMSLSDEVIAIILGYNDITIEDIINFRCLCKQFQWAAKYDKFWEKKIFQRWPTAKKHWDKQSKENKQESESCKINFMKMGIKYARELRSSMSEIIHEYSYKSRRINNLIRFDSVFGETISLKKKFDPIFEPKHDMKYSFFIDELKNLLTQSPRTISYNLTERYCSTKMLYYMRQQRARKELSRELFQERSQKQFLEWQATMAAQCLQPEKDISYSCVKESLDSIAAEALDYLKKKYPAAYSIYSMSDRDLLSPF